ncbi:hypothetical protein pEaSNUABM37_00082 [Erwinia phage pEa_SNUABM_37]|nr:hypothetical protein pEaSNUABM37_00082 [Erwinia phage pEa_SNUABM_37]QXO10552.1 hypothetical protein pEaSNUABM48_00082 [Erwinia phage pEa_SNUABM_48]
MKVTGITKLEVAYRFNTEMMHKYYELFKQAKEARKKLRVYADPIARERLQQNHFPVFTDGEFAELDINAYPNDEMHAANIGRGMSNGFVLIIDWNGRYTDILSASLAASGTTGYIVKNLVETQR